MFSCPAQKTPIIQNRRVKKSNREVEAMIASLMTTKLWKGAWLASMDLARSLKKHTSHALVASTAQSAPVNTPKQTVLIK